MNNVSKKECCRIPYSLDNSSELEARINRSHVGLIELTNKEQTSGRSTTAARGTDFSLALVAQVTPPIYQDNL